MNIANRHVQRHSRSKQTKTKQKETQKNEKKKTQLFFCGLFFVFCFFFCIVFNVPSTQMTQLRRHSKHIDPSLHTFPSFNLCASRRPADSSDGRFNVVIVAMLSLSEALLLLLLLLSPTHASSTTARWMIAV